MATTIPYSRFLEAAARRAQVEGNLWTSMRLAMAAMNQIHAESDPPPRDEEQDGG